jgi:hypothetical protein
MFAAIFILANTNAMWFVFPLSAAISLVYSASRYELPDRIVRRSSRLFLTISGFMACVLFVLWLLSMNL